MISEIRLFNQKKVLFVDDKPFYAVAGEVHNSDSSSIEYMEEIWKIADELGLNTLLLPVTWELTEPIEGEFDFSIPDALIDQARANDKKIIFLWFGSWKNAEMMYAPEWVKRDRKRFKRAEIVKGEAKSLRNMGPYTMPYYSLSYLCEETMYADANAFSKLMRHIKEVDEDFGTVIGIQVENETGLLGNSREVSDEADLVFESSVPAELALYMRKNTDTMHEDVREAIITSEESGSWSQVFGAVADEVFSSYHIARYVNYVAEKGMEEYKLPTFANCWLAHKGEKPGQYPSGGPVSRMHDVWRYCAPAIDVFSPDIYVPDFMDVCDDYSKNQPLFIPEAATHSYAASRLAYCIGHYHAMGYSPFGFDDIGKPFTMVQGFLFGMDVNDPALKTPQDYGIYSWFGKTLSAMMPILANCYGTSDLQALCAERASAESVMDFGKIKIAGIFEHPYLQLGGNGVVLAVKISNEEYFIIGYQAAVSIIPGDAKNFDILEFEEGKFVDGCWVRGRRLNGDEGTNFTMTDPQLYRVKIHTYNDEI